MTKDRFDQEAADWDNNPVTVESSKKAFAQLKECGLLRDSSGSSCDVLEIGCGTGLLTVLVAPEVNSITAVDSSSGMIKALKAKLAKNAALSNIKAVEALLEDADDPRIRTNPDVPQRYNLAISHLVLHHIPDLLPFLTLIYNCLGDGGMVALTDFENEGPQSRAFHPESKMEGVERHGIKKSEIEALMKQAGFKDIGVTTTFSIEKEVESGGTQMFPFLMIIGHK